MKIENKKSIQALGTSFTVAQVRKLIEGASDSDKVSVHTQPYYNQFDTGSTTMSITVVEEV